MVQVPPLTREQSRLVDQRAIADYGMSSLVLMENAGRGVADALCELGLDDRVVVCCGTGNNGGDGFVIARHLDLRRKQVRVLVWGDTNRFTPDAATNFAILQKADVAIELLGDQPGEAQLAAALLDARAIVDALLGTGARGEPRPPLPLVIDQLNASGLPIVAVDLPSGLDCDTGHPAAHTIRAEHTCTFVAPKIGFLAPGAAEFTGKVRVVDIGAPRQLIDELLH